MPVKLKVRTEYLIELMKEFGPDLGEPHTKKMAGDKNKGLFELRCKAKEGISRSLFCTQVGKKIFILRTFIKKTQKTPNRALKIALKRKEEV